MEDGYKEFAIIESGKEPSRGTMKAQLKTEGIIGFVFFVIGIISLAFPGWYVSHAMVHYGFSIGLGCACMMPFDMIARPGRERLKAALRLAFGTAGYLFVTFVFLSIAGLGFFHSAISLALGPELRDLFVGIATGFGWIILFVIAFLRQITAR